MALTQVGTASAGISKVIDGQNQYIFWRFSANPDGNPMTEKPTEDTKYMGVYTSTQNKPSENPNEYIWTKIKGEDGSDGQNSYSGILTDELIAVNTDSDGNNGNFSKASTSIILFEGSRENTSEWTISVEVTTGIQGSLTSSKDTYKVSAMTVDSGEIIFTAKYKTITLTKIAKIIKVKQGAAGIPGEDGVDGRTQYTHIAYADNESGQGLSFNPANKKYIGMYVDFTETNSSDPAKYKWSLIKGADGEDGIDGKTPYFHTAYSWSKDGTDRFTTIYPQDNKLENTQNPSVTKPVQLKGSHQILKQLL